METLGISKATYFSNSIGVFQGGGCKAIAYLGAYRAAHERGIMFSELAGTSAGSIFAALIAAGASPDDIESIIREEDFSQFTKTARTNEKRCNILHSRHKNTFWAKIKAISSLFLIKANLVILRALKVHKIFSDVSIEDFAEVYGIYDSLYIQDKVNEWLRNLCKVENLTFKDLTVPLYIVSGDVSRHDVKIWNQQETPDELVAKAVAASCSIPVFFAPIDKCHVDGGIIANRPDFIFHQDNPHYFQVLSFSLKSKTEKNIENIKDFYSELVSTIVEGADNIQHRIIREVNEVNISTPDGISATDFDKMTEANITALIKAGEEAMVEFLSTECPSRFDNCIITPHSHLHNIEQMLSEVAFWSYNPLTEVVISTPNLDWVWPLFPTLFSWISNGTKVIVFHYDYTENQSKILPNLIERYKNKAEAKRRLKKLQEKDDSIKRMLNAIGCHVENTRSKIHGFFFNKNSRFFGVSYDDSNDTFKAKIYSEPIDSIAIQSMLDSLEIKKRIADMTQPKIAIKRAEVEEIISPIKNIRFYQEASLSFEKIDLSKVRFMNQYVRGLKYKQIASLFNVYESADIELFAPTKVVFNNGQESLMSPIVVEEHEGLMFVIKGNVRSLFAYKHGIKEIVALVVRGVSANLPTEDTSFSYSIDEVVISENKLTQGGRYGNFKYELFRNIEYALRPTSKYLL